MEMSSKPRVSFEFEVEKVVGISSEGNYRVQWAPAWVNKFHLIGCEDLIREFLREQSEGDNGDNNNDNNGDNGEIKVEPEIPQETPDLTREIGKLNSVREESSEQAISHQSSTFQNLETGRSATGEYSIVLVGRAEKTSEKTVSKSVNQVMESHIQHNSPDLEQHPVFQDADYIALKVEEEDSISTPNGDRCPETLLHFVQNACSDSVCGDNFSASLDQEDEYYNGSQPSVEINEQSGPTLQHTSLNFLTEHLDMQLNKSLGKNQCPHCEKEFRRPCDLRRHIRIHTREQPFSCSLCDYTCFQKIHMKLHERTHTGEKPYQCSYCSLKFTRNDALKNHLRTHVGETLFTCELCGKSFAQQNSLSRHMAVHTGAKKFNCSYCDYSCVRKYHLQQHLRGMHTGEKPYVCDVCGKRFKQQGSLNAHMRKCSDASHNAPSETMTCGEPQQTHGTNEETGVARNQYDETTSISTYITSQLADDINDQTEHACDEYSRTTTYDEPQLACELDEKTEDTMLIGPPETMTYGERQHTVRTNEESKDAVGKKLWETMTYGEHHSADDVRLYCVLCNVVKEHGKFCQDCGMELLEEIPEMCEPSADLSTPAYSDSDDDQEVPPIEDFRIDPVSSDVEGIEEPVKKKKKRTKKHKKLSISKSESDFQSNPRKSPLYQPSPQVPTFLMDQTTPQDFLDGDESIPILYRGKRNTLPIERAEIIQSEKWLQYRVTARPSPEIDVMLLLNRSALPHPADWTVHDKGSFQNWTRSYTLITDGRYKKLTKRPTMVEDKSVLVMTVSYRHANSLDFRRRATFVQNCDGENPNILLEYWFEGPPHPVTPKRDKYGKPCVQTLPSVLAALKGLGATSPEIGARIVLTAIVDAIVHAENKSSGMPFVGHSIQLDHTTPHDFLNGDERIPILFRGKKDTSPNERAEIIQSEKWLQYRVTARPSPEIDVMLLLNRSALPHPDDWTIHDKGSFQNWTRSYTLISDGRYKKLTKKPTTVEDKSVLVTTVSYRHANSLDFRRRATFIQNCDGENPNILLEYSFEGPAHPVTPKMNRYGKPFIQTLPSVLAALKASEAANLENEAKTAFKEAVGDGTEKKLVEMPRNAKQIANIRLRLKEKQDDNQLPEVMDYAGEHPDTIQKLITTPSVSFVYCPPWLLQNIVDECCSPDSRSILRLDATYNVGKFYVTPITYTRQGVLSIKTGSPGTFPGPALFHQKQTNREFFSFAATLREINENISNCRFIGGDRDNAQRYFTHLMPGHLFLSCTKQVEDDIRRELDDLHLKWKVKEEYIAQIFGSVELGRKGLMNAQDEEQFLLEYKEVSQDWDIRFTQYFEKNIKDDMVKGMLLSTREYLGIDRFYNNGDESMHFKYKNLIEEHVVRTRGQMRTKAANLSYVEAIEVYERLVDQHQKDLSTAFSYKELYSIVGFDGNWDEVTPTERESLLAKVDNFLNNTVLSEV